MKPLSEQTILVTGATDGLGRALAEQLSDAGATVLAHGRNADRLEGVPAARGYTADLASLAEVDAMADQLLARERQIDTLVNNAGIGGLGTRADSSDGYELHFAVNYLSHYLLTRKLLPLIQSSAPARIVNVSSAGQIPIDFDDPLLERGWESFRAYAQSKLAQVLFTFDLGDELSGDDVTANCLHPATYMPTKMVFAAGATPASSLEEGRDAVMRLIADESLDGVSGRYFNGTREARADGQAYDLEARARLRELSDRLIRDALAG
jgi:NAD(P)-dependent dehydrogenase (short-subunit alcohol dehydrogenase family)